MANANTSEGRIRRSNYDVNLISSIENKLDRFYNDIPWDHPEKIEEFLNNLAEDLSATVKSYIKVLTSD